MLDTIVEIFDFLQGTAYFVYTLCSAANNVIDFFLQALPFAKDFFSMNFGHSLFEVCSVLCLGLGTLKFLYPGADG